MNLAIYLISAGLLILFALVVFRIIVRRDYQQRGRTSGVSATLELLVCIAYMAFPYTYLPSDWYLLPAAYAPPLRRWVAIALITIGVALTLFTLFYTLGPRRAMGWRVDKLIEAYPYNISRNPGIVCFALVVLGVVVFWPYWGQLGWLALYVIIFHMMVITEEEHLANIFGDAYQDYCNRVPRYAGLSL